MFKINSKMYFLLMSKAIDDFTVAGLHDAYNQAGLASSCHQKDRKFLYRQIFKLEKKGLLDKSGEEYSRQIRYQKTALLHASSIQPLDAKKVENDFPSEEKVLPDIQELKSTMHEYQVKFVSSLGESEEYRRLLIKFPNLRAQIQEKYHKTRDNSSRYLGRIHALREVIAVHYQG